MPKRKGRVAEKLRDLVVPLAQLQPDPANVRKHGDRSIEAIKASLARFGQQKPVVVDAAGVVIAGNGMLEAARQLGWKEIAAVRSGLDGVERVAYAIADNRTAELSEWDTEALEELIGSMPPDAVEAMGFTVDELVELGLVREPELEDDDVPDPATPAVTVAGDLWLLGDHRLLCGDSTTPEDVARVMDGARAQLVATDPPYIVNYTGERLERGKDWSATYREVEIADGEAFYTALFTNILEVMDPHAALYCWHAHLWTGRIQQIWDRLGILDHQQIIWVKPTPVFGRMTWLLQHEPCIMGWRKGSRARNAKGNAHGSVWTTAAGNRVLDTGEGDAWLADWEGKARIVGNEHPTQKPVEIFARPMRKHTKPGDLVFEPFSGSGTQLVAAEKLGRVCRAIELQPVFVDVAIRRWQALTGREATLASSGRTWTETAEERARCRGSRRRSAPTAAATASPTPARSTARRTSPRPKLKPKPRPGQASRAQPTRAGTARRGAA